MYDGIIITNRKKTRKVNNYEKLRLLRIVLKEKLMIKTGSGLIKWFLYFQLSLTLYRLTFGKIYRIQ